MKKVFLSLIMLVSISSMAFSQRGNNNRGDQSRMVKSLELSEEQQQKMRKLNEGFRENSKALRADESLTREAKREKMKELSAAKRTETQAVLTPDQKKKWEEMHSGKNRMARKDSREKRMYTRHHHSKGMRADLNLTEDQKGKMSDLRKDFRSQMKALKEDTTLDKEAKDTKRKELAAAHKNSVQSILTPEQQDKMKKSPSNRSRMRSL